MSGFYGCSGGMVASFENGNVKDLAVITVSRLGEKDTVLNQCTALYGVRA